MKLLIVFWGSSKLSEVVLRKLLISDKFEIQAVVTSFHTDIVSAVAKKNKIPLLRPQRLNREFIEENKKFLSCEVNIVAAYGKIIPQKILDMAKIGNINVHGSVLPKYRGASPIQAAILNGDRGTGVTVMLMDKKMDHGSILSVAECPVAVDETFESLEAKMAEIGAKLLLLIIPDYINGKLKPKVQNHGRATYVSLIKKEDGYFDIDNPPSMEKLDRMIRAYYPWPGVWSRWRGKIVKFYPKGRIQMEGKQKTTVGDFLRGYSEFPKRLLGF